MLMKFSAKKNKNMSYLFLLCRNDSNDSNVRLSGFFKKQSFF